MSVADFPPGRRPPSGHIDAAAFASLSSWGAQDSATATNPFKPAAHPPGVAPKNGMALDDAFGTQSSEVTQWAWNQLEVGIRAGMGTMAFLGFPALANLSQQAEHRRIVETLAMEMTRKWIRFTSSGEDDKTDKIKRIQAEFARLHVREVFKKVAEHDGFYGRGHIYLDLTNANDDAELATSIGTGIDNVSRAKVARSSLKALRVVEPVWVYPQDFDSTDPLSPNFYRPQTWLVQNKRIHTSRLLTFVARPVSDLLKPAYSFGGVPMTQIAMLYVDNWVRIRDSVGKLVDSFSVTGLKTKLAEAMNSGMLNAGGATDLQRRVALFTSLRNNQGTFVLDQDEEFFNVNIPLGGLDELQAQAQEHMAAVSGIPLVKLLGISPHGLNASSEGEIRVFYDWVHATQEFFFRNNLEAILRFVQINLDGEVDPDIGIEFEPLWSSSEMEIAQVHQTDANTDKTYIDAGVLTAKEVRRKIANDKDMPYSGLKLADAPDLSESERSENATRVATPILSAFTDGIIKSSKALEELVEAGVFKTVTQEDIDEAKAADDQEPPAPEPGVPPQGQGGAPGGPGGGVPLPHPPSQPQQQAPHTQPLRLANASDEKFDLGKLSKLQSEEMIAAIRDGDMEKAQRILSERETYRGAWDSAGGFTVYHGSPFDIGQFDASRVGSGEGNTTGWKWSYGNGLYFAQNPKVAAWYRDELSSRVNLGGKPLALNAATTHISGHIYKVHVSRNPSEFIDWDRPLDAQTPLIRSALVRVLGDQVLRAGDPNARTAGDLLKFLPPGMSKKFAAAGIAGVKYLDAGSRTDGGTHNYVVFDPKDVTIVDKDGMPIAQDAFSESEKRDEDGKWTSGGAASPGLVDHIGSIVAQHDDGQRRFGLRVDEHPAEVGGVLPRSRRWKNGEPTRGFLKGTSVVGLKDTTPDAIRGALRKIAPNNYSGYYGKHLSLVSGRPIAKGEDAEEHVLADPVVHSVYERPDNMGFGFRPRSKAGVAQDRFNEGEKRAPKGSHQGGQFTSGGWDPAKGQQKPAGEPAGEAEHDPEAERISTRVPTAKAKKGQTLTDPHGTSEFTSSYEAAKSDPASFAKNVATIRAMPGLGATKNMSDEQTAEYFINHVQSNVLALWHAVPDEIKSRSKLWYDGANKMAHDWSEHFGIEPRAAAACIAALSPRKDWFQNMSLAHRVIDTIKNHSDEKFTQRMTERFEQYAAAKESGSGNPNSKNYVKPNPEGAALVRGLAQEFKGKTLADIKDPAKRAYFVRFLDETENTRAFPVLSPEGDVIGSKKTDQGADARVVWQGFDNIAKAIAVIDDPSQENISKRLGGNHKVRNFYNNIIAPNSLRGDTTIDTHAIGAGNLMPWSSADKEVNVGLGTGGSGSAKTGMKGLYALYQEAYARAAKSEGVLPREMQSVTWEAQRGLFTDDQKNANLTKQIKGVWEDVDRGKLSADDARKQILSRGIKPPDWFKPAGGANGGKGGAADTGELHRSELGQSGRRGRDRAAGTFPLGLDDFGEYRRVVGDTFNTAEPRDHGKWTSGAAVGADPKAPHRPHVEYSAADPRERQAAQLSWESAPGKTTNNMPQFHDAPLAQRREYQKAIEAVLADDKGEDVIAKSLGLRTGPTFSSAGVFQGRVNPGAQSQVVGNIGDDDKAKINASEAIRGILLRQDAAAWHKPENPEGHPFLIPGIKTAKGVVFPEDKGKALTHKDALAAMSPEDQADFLAHGKENDANYVFKNDKGQVLSRIAARKYAEENGLLSAIGKGYKQPKLISEHVDPKYSTRFTEYDPEKTNMVDFRMGRTPTEEEAQSIDKSLSSISGLEYALVPTEKGWRVLNTGSMPNPEFTDKVHHAIEGLDSDTIGDVKAVHGHYVGDYIGNDWSKSPHGEDYERAIGQAGPDVQRSANTLLAQLGPKIADIEDQFGKKYGWQPDASSRVWNKGPAQDLLARNGGAPHEGQVDQAAANALNKHGVADQVAGIREKLKTVVPTDANVKDGGHKLDDGSYTPERSALHDQILSELFHPDAVAAATPAPGKRPKMTILGGRGGSGKSWLTGDDGPVNRKNTLVVDSDAFKQKLPEYQGWNAAQVHEESSHIADRAASIAKAKGLNVAFDQTMKSGSSAPKRIAQFHETHDLEGHYMHATPEVAADRAVGRFAKGGKGADKTGRFVPPEYILGSYGNEANFDAVRHHFKKWSVWDNNGERGAPKKVVEGKND